MTLSSSHTKLKCEEAFYSPECTRFKVNQSLYSGKPMEHSHRYTKFIIIKPRQSSPLEFQCLHQIAEIGQFYIELHHTNFKYSFLHET